MSHDKLVKIVSEVTSLILKLPGKRMITAGEETKAVNENAVLGG
jgi:hypothetical protein